MNRPPTPAGPLFVKRGANPRVPLSINDVGRQEEPRTSGRLPLRPGAIRARPGGQAVIFDLQHRTSTDSTRVRRPLAVIDRNVPKDCSYSNIADRLQQSRENDSKNRTRRVLLPVVAGQQARVTSGKSVQFGSRRQPKNDAVGDKANDVPAPTMPVPPNSRQKTTSAKKTVKFMMEEKVVHPANSSSSSVKSDNKQSSTLTFCEVKGIAFGKENKAPEISQRRVIRRVPTSVVNSLSRYRQQLIAKQTQEAKYASDNTKLSPDCVIRRPEPMDPPNLRATSPQRNTRLLYRIPTQPPGLREDMHLSSAKAEDNETELAQAKLNPGPEILEEKRFSYKLAERAEQLFTRNLRHHDSGTVPNVVKTYVVEEDPNVLLSKLDNSPASLTTKNIEMHNSWWTSVENKEKICQHLNVREKRIRRWMAEMESTSRLNHMRVVNIIVKDRGNQVRPARDDTLERLSQVPAQVVV